MHNEETKLFIELLQTYFKKHDLWIDDANSLILLQLFGSSSFLSENFFSHPNAVLDELQETNDLLCVPVSLLGIRHIFKNKSIYGHSFAASKGFAKRFLKDYSIILEFKKKDIISKPILDLKNISIYENLEFSKVNKVYAFDRSDSVPFMRKINIIKNFGLELNSLAELPGLSITANSHGRFVVNISTIGLNNEVIKANTKEEALKLALQKAWDRQSSKDFKDQKFDPNFWIGRGMLDVLVKPQLVKTANAENEIVLNETEKKIFDFLININVKYNLNSTFRAAGGWIRDKLLGKESDDIDIAIDNMTGSQLGQYIAQQTGTGKTITFSIISVLETDAKFKDGAVRYWNSNSGIKLPDGKPVELSSLSEDVKDAIKQKVSINLVDSVTQTEHNGYVAYTVKAKTAGNTIKANPEQSKQLETMTIKLFGQDVDFVNLRSETYGDSRIPTMEFGTAEQDASRRDLTINSLFYNINTKQIEDFNGTGIEDLKNKVIRTPLDPIQTFKDDPLRIFRMLRFYARYEGSKIDPGAVEAMKAPDVQEALKNKISPERIYKEWGKLIIGPQKTDALRILHSTGLWDNILKPAEAANHSPFTMDQNNPHHKDNVLEHSLKVIDGYDAILKADGADDEERAKALTAAFLHDLGKLSPEAQQIKTLVDGTTHNTYHGHEDVSEKLSESFLSAFKASNEDIQYIKTITKYHMAPHNEMSDKYLRKLMRELGSHMLKRIVQHAKADSGSKPGANLEHYDNLLNRMQTIVPSTPANVNKPVLDGGTIMQMFPNLSPKSGYLRYIQTHLQDLKDGDPTMDANMAKVVVENMRAEVEAKFSQPQTPQKTAQTYQSEMINLGVPKTVAWKCGTVVLNNDKTYLYDGSTQYKIKLVTSKEYEFKDLSELVGSQICARGSITGDELVISTYNVLENKDDGNAHTSKGSVKDIIKFKAGDYVKHRQRGVSFEQIKGKIERIQNNLMYVKWEGIRDYEVFNLDDTITIYRILEKI